MKVYIGPYVDRMRCNIHDRYMDKKYKYDWPHTDKYTRFENFLMRLESAVQFIYNHTINLYLDKRVRKVKIRIDRYDTWSMDDTLAMLILPMLKQLNETKHGHPMPDAEDAPHIGMGEEDPCGHDTKAEARWQWIMDEMIWTFEQIVNDDDYDNYYDPYEPGEAMPTEGFFSVYVAENLGKFNKEKHAAYEARINNGTRLFGKYFRNLWD